MRVLVSFLGSVAFRTYRLHGWQKYFPLDIVFSRSVNKNIAYNIIVNGKTFFLYKIDKKDLRSKLKIKCIRSNMNLIYFPVSRYVRSVWSESTPFLSWYPYWTLSLSIQTFIKKNKNNIGVKSNCFLSL